MSDYELLKECKRENNYRLNANIVEFMRGNNIGVSTLYIVKRHLVSAEIFYELYADSILEEFLDYKALLEGLLEFGSSLYSQDLPLMRSKQQVDSLSGRLHEMSIEGELLALLGSQWRELLPRSQEQESDTGIYESLCLLDALFEKHGAKVPKDLPD